jgi:signal transduction histidine kinase
MKLTELVDISELRELCESITWFTGAATGVLDLEGNVLSASGWQRICTDFHRTNPATANRCRESDTCLAGLLDEGESYNVYRCKNGMFDVAVPIAIGDKRVARLFTGQFFFEPPDRRYFIRQAEEFGFDKDSYLAALDDVPVLSADRVRSMMVFFTRLARLIGEMGLARKTLHDANAELRRHQQHLEDLVTDRTAELSRKNGEMLAEIAERARLAAELTEADRLKDIFTDVLRHDILNPVHAIMLLTTLLLEMESDTKKADLLHKVRRSTMNLTEMTVNAAKLATMTACQSLECFASDPVQVMRSVLPDLEHRFVEKNITLADHAGSGFPARFNPMMKDVFANLISNAIKYSPDGTRVDVDVEDRGVSWVLSVKDQGNGVADEHKQRIFNRFERLEKEGVKGSGLGLTITKEIVRLHGGAVWVEDNPAGGSIFLVELPKTPSAA